jgi:hypothetical protein
MTTAPAGHKSHTGRNVGIIAVVIIVLIVAFLLLTQGSPLSPIRPSTVLVSGNVSTVGAGTHPVSISFTSDNGQVFSAPVVNGVYSINLPNDHTYLVQIAWSGLLGASGTCKAGSLTVSVGPGSSGLTNNWSC